MDRTSQFNALVELELGVRELASSVRWQEFLRMQATLRQYSYRNTLLILRQFPKASQVAGYRSWRSLGRTVKRGERAIWIIAPKRPSVKFDASTPSELHRGGFVPVPVFDVSQTTGRPLPEVCHRLEGSAGEDSFECLVGLAARIGFDVKVVDLGGGVNGDCSHARRLIRIEQRNSPAQRVKSLAHEVAHALLHEHAPDRLRVELEAESVAYLVCKGLGLDSREYTFGYLATWAGGAERASLEIHRSCQRIIGAADWILETLDQPSRIQAFFVP